MPRAQVGLELRETLGVQGAQRVHGPAFRQGSERGESVGGGLGRVGLVEHEHGARARIVELREVAHESIRVQVVVDPADEQDRVDVRGEQLRRGPGATRAPQEAASPGEHVGDAGVLGALRSGPLNPVADGGQGLGRVREAPGPRQRGPQCGGLARRQQLEGISMCGANPRHGPLGVGRRRPARFKKIEPSQGLG